MESATESGGSGSRELQRGLALRKLSLVYNLLTCVSAHGFARALAVSGCSVAYLNLSHNRIGNEGVHTLARSVAYNTTLKTLDIGRNSASDAAAKALRNSMDPTARQRRVAHRNFRAAARLVLLAHFYGSGARPTPSGVGIGTEPAAGGEGGGDEVEPVQPDPLAGGGGGGGAQPITTGFASLPTIVAMLVLELACPEGFVFG